VSTISLRCGGCRARIKAPFQLYGQMRSCPGCGHRFVVQVRRPEDAGPALVYETAPADRTASPGRC
jgi:DNA-directed RNA polymerase subunit RPC12/RpoP